MIIMVMMMMMIIMMMIMMMKTQLMMIRKVWTRLTTTSLQCQRVVIADACIGPEIP
ncbi:unnamed protein product, partial [Candidula unifasciata]